ncbi:glycosyltransferase [Halalkalibacter sp. APA_J-10(15)]|uniref:glycosyltransferase n=1 Tax=Halalkalibacter sp. APA_J-10(15) TaxID=2933805 RepID=UPI001FF2CEFD|nr:glycosyltransferase [Halalkalibacter sp. APA_J-10(15)]MCK0470086.1 glycosyltransferase family 4 protein [Halalkalibacter sp. APA_J-10(15)]
MKVVFAHDHIFKKDSEGNLFTTGSFNNVVWKRYIQHFDSIVVTARLDNRVIDTQKKYNNFDLQSASFVEIPTLSGPIAQFRNRISAKDKLSKAIKESDAVIARLPSEIGNLAITIAKEMNKPYAVEIVACVWDALWNYGKLQAKIYAPIAMYKMKKNVKNAPRAIYVTNTFLQSRYPCNGLTENISNVEIKEIKEENLSARIKKIDQNNKKIKIGMIGNLNNRIKGWDIALKALSLIKQNGLDFEFKILGDGETEQWRRFAEELNIEEDIHFCGVLPGGEPVLSWLDEIDIYIQPSFQEGLPRAVIEAMSRACPVVGSSAGGIRELIDNSCIHKAGDYTGLSKKILSIIGDPNQLKAIALRNFEEAKYYKKDTLDYRRNIFWKEFIKSI